jgi:CheY-like chemotaxis protein
MVETIVPEDSNVPEAQVDAVIVDADAACGALYDSLSRNRGRWGLHRAPVITIAHLRPAGARAGVHGETVVATPVRTQALYEALCAVVRRSPAPIDRVVVATPVFDGTRLAVLLVEDNESNRRVVALMLGELGLHADEAGGGYEAIDRVRRRPYDIILMDVQMPDIDGLETTRRIRAEEHDRHATIIALTANVFESDEARCRAAGMDGYLQKPLSLDTLAAALRTVATSTP